MNTLEVSKLDAESFADYGDVIEAKGQAMEINQGSTLRFNDLGAIDVTAQGGRPLFNIFRATPLAQPIAISMLERHPLSSQAFFPLDNRPYLVVVAAAGEQFEAGDIKAFLAHGRQGVNYHRGTWHHPLLALEQESDFIVIDRGGDGDNCEEHTLDKSQIRTIKL